MLHSAPPGVYRTSVQDTWPCLHEIHYAALGHAYYQRRQNVYGAEAFQEIRWYSSRRLVWHSIIGWLWGTNNFGIGPKLVLVASKSAIQKVIVEEDLIKSPEYERGRNDPKVTNLLTERDKVAYKQKVYTSGILFLFLSYPNRVLETLAIAWILY